jgi:hypothetical protein
MLLMAPYSGTEHQLGFILSGPPGCSKSFITSILAGNRRTLEIAKVTDKFTMYSLKNVDLLTMSDITEWPVSLLQTIRNVLGRYRSNPRRMHREQIQENFIPNCVVVITTNVSFDQMAPFQNDSALLNKVACIQFSREDIIDQDRMITSYEYKVDSLIPDLLNWALYMPSKQLGFWTRGTMLQELERAIVKKENEEDRYETGGGYRVRDFQMQFEIFLQLNDLTTNPLVEIPYKTLWKSSFINGFWTKVLACLINNQGVVTTFFYKRMRTTTNRWLKMEDDKWRGPSMEVLALRPSKVSSEGVEDYIPVDEKGRLLGEPLQLKQNTFDEPDFEWPNAYEASQTVVWQRED